MGGAMQVLRARTKKGLEEKAREWTRNMKDIGLEDIRLGWDPKRAEKAEDGWWEIRVWAHT